MRLAFTGPDPFILSLQGPADLFEQFRFFLQYARLGSRGASHVLHQVAQFLCMVQIAVVHEMARTASHHDVSFGLLR